MPDIFISYSRKDSLQAIELADRLRANGIEVWIDQRGIVGAEQWATEIVEGIRACNTFIILISPNSIESENVLRELSLASEKRKRVLPVVIEPTILPSSFEYPLAGLQHVPFVEFDRIMHAHKHGVEKVIHKDERKSIMILPFEDLSPTGDNAWFADGIVSELISALSNVKSIRIADNQATKEFKKYAGQLTTYAREMNYRYFVQGDVRKFGDQIKISSRLLDIETGDHLWQNSMKGVMDNIFDFQEEVALKVVEGLKVHLAADEKEKLSERGTENTEAYELFLKAGEYFSRQTMEGFRFAVQLFTEAIRLDPGYRQVYHSNALALIALYSRYDRDPGLLDEAEKLVKEGLKLSPTLNGLYNPLSLIYMHRGQLAEGEEAAKEYIRKDPQNWHSHFTLGFFYLESGQPSKAIAPLEESVRLRPDNLPTLWNLVGVCESADEREKCAHWAEVTLPLVERHLKLRPDDEGWLVFHALVLLWSGRAEAARAAAMKFKQTKDGGSLYNTACLFVKLDDKWEALGTLRNALEAGFKNTRLLKNFLALDDIASLAGTPEYEEVKRMVEKIDTESQ